MGLIKLLGSGGMLVLGRSMPASLFAAHFAALAGLGVLWCLALLARDLAYGGNLNGFYAEVLLANMAFIVFLYLAIALVLGRHYWQSRRQLFAAMLAALVALLVLEIGFAYGWRWLANGEGVTASWRASLATTLASTWGDSLTAQPWLIFLPVAVLLALPACLAALRGICGPRHRFRALTLWLLLAAMLVLLPSPFIAPPRYADFGRNLSLHARYLAWAQAQAAGLLPIAENRDDDPEDDAETELPYDVENVLARQTELLDRRLATLLPERPGQRDLYVLAAAGFAGQGVFMREVDQLERLASDSLAGTGRTVTLINRPERVETAPLASPRNLERALAGIGRVMNAKDDVLLVYLTSHGLPNRFALRMSGMPFRDLRPEQLRQMLDKSGIVNRVIVVSACYSGSFVDALKNDDTLVITAASAETTSFGCADENEWTWFGDAFINNGLRHTATILEAFAMAETLVKEWETRDNLTPSLPQIAQGKRIAAILAQLPRPPVTSKPAAE